MADQKDLKLICRQAYCVCGSKKKIYAIPVLSIFTHSIYKIHDKDFKNKSQVYFYSIDM